MTLKDRLEKLDSKWRRTPADVAAERLPVLVGLCLAVYGLYRSLQRNIAGEMVTNVLREYSRPVVLDPEVSASIPGNTYYDPGLEYVIKHPAPSEKKVMVLSTGGSETQIKERMALAEMISSYFGTDVFPMDYHDLELGQVNGADMIVVLGNADPEPDASLHRLIEQAYTSGKPVCWMGFGIDKLPGVGKGKDFGIDDVPVMKYNGVDIPLDFSGAIPVEIKSSFRVMSDYEVKGIGRFPAIFREGHNTYISFNPMANLSYSYAQPALLDILSSDIGGHETAPRAIMRLEDINSRVYDGRGLAFTETVAYLLSEGIPLHLGLIPLFKENNFYHSIWDLKPLADVLAASPESFMIVQHGAQHHREDPRNRDLVSGEATEFFFDDDEKMGPDNSRRFAQRRLVEGYNILAEGGLFPQAFEAPHYEISPLQQEVAETLFPIMSHPYMAGIKDPFLHPLLLNHEGTIYCPNEVGYVSGDDPSSVDRMLKTAEDLTHIMPDPLVTVMYHPFMTKKAGREKDIVRVIDGFKEMGYSFHHLMDLLEPYHPGNGTVIPQAKESVR